MNDVWQELVRRNVWFAFFLVAVFMVVGHFIGYAIDLVHG